MSKKPFGNLGSPKEAKAVRQNMDRPKEESKGKLTKQPSVKSELGEHDMRIRTSGEEHMGGVKKGSGPMGRAARHLERDTERKEHAPTVGGHKNDHYTH